MGILLDIIREEEECKVFNGFAIVSGDNRLHSYNSRAGVTRYLQKCEEPHIFAQIYFRGRLRVPEPKSYICNGETWIKYVSKIKST